MFKMAEQSDGYSGETLLAPCKRKKLQRKMTKDYYWMVFKKTPAESNVSSFPPTIFAPDVAD